MRQASVDSAKTRIYWVSIWGGAQIRVLRIWAGGCKQCDGDTLNELEGLWRL